MVFKVEFSVDLTNTDISTVRSVLVSNVSGVEQAMKKFYDWAEWDYNLLTIKEVKDE